MGPLKSAPKLKSAFRQWVVSLVAGGRDCAEAADSINAMLKTAPSPELGVDVSSAINWGEAFAAFAANAVGDGLASAMLDPFTAFLSLWPVISTIHLFSKLISRRQSPIGELNYDFDTVNNPFDRLPVEKELSAKANLL